MAVGGNGQKLAQNMPQKLRAYFLLGNTIQSPNSEVGERWSFSTLELHGPTLGLWPHAPSKVQGASWGLRVPPVGRSPGVLLT